MITKERIVEMLKDAQVVGHTITVKDVAFCILKKQFGSAEIAYKTLFNKEATDVSIELYEKSDSTKHIEKIVASELNKGKTKKTQTDDLTFDENKAEMIKLLAKIDKGLEDGEIAPKDAMKMQVDIRTKLNDKFGTSEAVNDQYVQVLTKFNTICPHTHKECYVATEKDLIKKYNLVSMNEIESKYELIPKQ